MEIKAPDPTSQESSGKGFRFPFASLGIASAAFILAAAALAANQVPNSDPYRPPAIGTWAWWWVPIEFNGHKRLPAIESDLKAVYAHPTTGDVWVVGDTGTFLHSADSGHT